MIERLDMIRAMRDQGETIPPAPPEPPPDEGGPGDEPPGGLPPDCPVVPLGVSGDQYHYLDALLQHRVLSAKDHSRNNLMSLYGAALDGWGTPLAWVHFPRKVQNKSTGEWEITGIKAEIAADTMMRVCARAGVWSALDRMRGPGAWLGGDGQLILHAGDALVVAEAGQRPRAEPPGRFEGHVYPAAPPCPRPDPHRQAGGKDGPAAQLLTLLQSWAWRRSEIDAYLMLGWVGAAMIGGATDWRAIAWVTGDLGTGKSTLQTSLKHLFGGALLQSPDATAAAVRQTLVYASLPVLIDEAEPDPDSRKMADLIKLARNAATGALALRGGADHQASQFVVRSAFLFGSILVPPLQRQDRSRIVVLDLDPLTGSMEPEGLAPKQLEQLGRRLLRRIVDHWPRLEETLGAYRAAMAEAGYSARGRDVYGTLLACADLLLHDALPASDHEETGTAAWIDKLGRAGVLSEEREGLARNECLDYLLTTELESPTDRKRYLIGDWIARAANRGPWATDPDQRDHARRVLLLAGLKLQPHGGQDYLAVANAHRGLARIFERTEWQSRSGLDGPWRQVLRRVPGHIVFDKTIWFGTASRATLVPLDVCVPPAGSHSSAADRDSDRDKADAAYSLAPDPFAP
jgi:hypothetical protein